MTFLKNSSISPEGDGADRGERVGGGAPAMLDLDSPALPEEDAARADM